MAKHELTVEQAISTRVEAPALDFSAVYARHFNEVCRWLRAMGGPEADLEDLAQDVFLVVRRRLVEFDGGNLRGWMYRIARNVAGDYRRRLFFRQIFHKRYEDSFDETWDVGDAPDRRLDETEARRTVARVLARMSGKKRTAFVLFEIEGYSSEEIARLEGIPEATVRTRVFHARREFRTLLQRISPMSHEELMAQSGRAGAQVAQVAQLARTARGASPSEIEPKPEHDLDQEQEKNR